jgi:hypothetical protein
MVIDYQSFTFRRSVHADEEDGILSVGLNGGSEPTVPHQALTRPMCSELGLLPSEATPNQGTGWSHRSVQTRILHFKGRIVASPCGPPILDQEPTKDLTGPRDLYEEPLNPGLVEGTEKLAVIEGVETVESELRELDLIYAPEASQRRLSMSDDV